MTQTPHAMVLDAGAQLEMHPSISRRRRQCPCCEGSFTRGHLGHRAITPLGFFFSLVILMSARTADSSGMAYGVRPSQTGPSTPVCSLLSFFLFFLSRRSARADRPGAVAKKHHPSCGHSRKAELSPLPSPPAEEGKISRRRSARGGLSQEPPPHPWLCLWCWATATAIATATAT